LTHLRGAVKTKKKEKQWKTDQENRKIFVGEFRNLSSDQDNWE